MSDELDPKTAEALDLEKAEARKALTKEAIEVGLKVDKRWSNERLTEEIGRKHVQNAQERAVTQAKTEIRKAADSDTVSARVLPMGNGKVSRGIHIPGKGDLYYATGDTMTVTRQLAESLQARGLVEIQNAAA